MVLRFDSNENQGVTQQEIYILETTANNGASIKRWSDKRANLGKFYERIAIRHLDFPRTDKSLTALETFLEQINGSKYSLSLG